MRNVVEKKLWYTKEAGEVLQVLRTSEKGLDGQEVQERQKRYGKNELTESGKKSTFRIFLEQFQDFLVVILIAAAILSGFLGDAESSVVIVVVITMNAILGTVQHKKAEQSLDSLKQMSAPHAKVLRDGNTVEVPASELVPGDILLLEAGDFVPADGRILENASMKLNESALTGESVTAEKALEALPEQTPLGDRKNMVFSGSFLTYGRGTAVVTDTGMETELGKIAALLKDTREKKTPLQISLDQFGRTLSYLILGICAVLFAVCTFRGMAMTDAFLFAVALAVAAIPEALSSIVTIVLAFGTSKLAKENAIIRKLQAVEGLGSISVICSDKTGTLTQNRMTVRKLYTAGTVYEAEDGMLEEADTAHRLVLDSLLCNDAQISGEQEIGDPTETALLRFGFKQGMDYRAERERYSRLAELPFDSERKRMSVAVPEKEGWRLVTKGAVDGLLPLVTRIETEEGVRALTEADRKGIEEINRSFSEQGLRVLAFASRTLEETEVCLESDTEKDYVFLGLIAMIDPPREESRQAVKACREAGIKPVMITGDHKITAAAIAKEIGILEDLSEAAEGSEVDARNDEQLRDFVEHISVYARVSPENKIRIVRAWQEKGHLVAMTGDGVNDAPALKQADVGVAMGVTGTEVSKDAAAMVLADDNFATIVKAVENGRNVYANIRKSIQFLLSGNTAGILTVVYASFLGLPIPFAPVHLLFINLLTDSLPAIALGLEPHERAVMKQKPRPRDEMILNSAFLKNMAVEGLIMAAATIASFYIGLYTMGNGAASTMAFTALCFSRLLHGFNCKSDRPVLFRRRFVQNRYLLGAFFAGSVCLLAVLFLPPLQRVFDVAALPGSMLLWAIVPPFLGFLIIQAGKGLWCLIKKGCTK
ncbi:MAG: cation-translocating P-type ATPase [Lachnospiraceae bacterium]|nr:cation-translocating P-type ATPase [Lachnospiraceae bacterium]